MIFPIPVKLWHIYPLIFCQIFDDSLLHFDGNSFAIEFYVFAESHDEYEEFSRCWHDIAHR